MGWGVASRLTLQPGQGGGGREGRKGRVCSDGTGRPWDLAGGEAQGLRWVRSREMLESVGACEDCSGWWRRSGLWGK